MLCQAGTVPGFFIENTASLEIFGPWIVSPTILSEMTGITRCRTVLSSDSGIDRRDDSSNATTLSSSGGTIRRYSLPEGPGVASCSFFAPGEAKFGSPIE
jgi:hypothetical protein